MVPELEGETCYHKDYTSVDPDVALSYIGERVHCLLGHLQKDFEGGISAENLGPKFGGYGSFLPSQQRSPSILTQPKPPKRVHNSHLQIYPNAYPEGPMPNLHSTQKVDSCSSLKTSLHDPSIKQKPTVAPDKVADVIPPLSKLCNPSDKRTLKVRIKMVPERTALYNVEICNLGLTSSSEGNSGDESDGSLNKSRQTPDESPSSILKMMTSFPPSGGLLLSPLCEDLLKLAREKEKPVESNAPKNPGMSVRLSNTNFILRKKAQSVDKSENTKKPENEVTVNRKERKQKPLGSDNVGKNLQPSHELNRKPLPDFVLETEKDGQAKKWKESKDKVKEKAIPGDLIKDTFPGHASKQCHGSYAQSEPRCSSVENIGVPSARISRKDILVDHGQGSKNRSKVNHASFKAYSDNSGGEEVKKSMDNASLKFGLNDTSTKHNVSGIPPALNRLSVEGEKREQGSLSVKLASKDKSSEKKGLRKLLLSKKQHVENPKHLIERPSGEKPRNLNLDAVKEKSASADKLKGKLSSKKCFDRLSYDTYMAESPPAPPAAAIHSKEGMMVNGLDQAVVAPQIIEENWVCCDRCEKWRLLPNGTKSEDLPEKWVCSMLDWLPRMNSCHFSEDETTKALNDLYLVPPPESQHNFQMRADGTIAGVISSNSHHVNQFQENRASDQKKKHTLFKEKRNAVGMKDSVPSNGKSQLQRLAVKSESSSKVMKQFLPGLNPKNNPDTQNPNKSKVVSEKPNKRKGEHVIEDENYTRMKNKRESTQHVNRMLKTMKPKEVDNFQTLDVKKTSVQRNSVSGGDCQISVKKCTYQVQDLPDSRPSSIKKITIKNYKCSPRQIKEENKDVDFHRDKNSQPSQTLDGKKMSVQRNTVSGGDCQIIVKKRTHQMQDLPDSRPSSIKKIKLTNYKCCPRQVKEESKDVDFHGDKKQSLVSEEYPVKRGIEKEQQQVSKPKAVVELTTQDIDKVKQDLGYEHPSTAATSSTSKVSGSRKSKVSCVKVNDSPEESVSSSPVRNEKLYSRFNNNVHAISNMKEICGVDESCKLTVARKEISSVTNDNGLETFDSRNKLKEETDIDVRNPFTDSSPAFKSVKKCTSVGGKKDFGDIEHDAKADALKQNSVQMELGSGKLHIDLRQGNKQMGLCHKKQASGLSRSTKRSMDSIPVDASVADNNSKAVKESAIACPQNVTDTINNESDKQLVALEASIGDKNVSTALKEAGVALREAEELRRHADLIKNSGFPSESNYEYFKAALKFLHGASLLETCNGESSKHVEMSPMQMYGAAGQLCKTCASEYEKCHEMAAASLVYKCMEVAFLRVVYCKSLNTSKVWHDLQSSLQMAPLGESPSSSASDIDNLNNLVMADKPTLSKGTGVGYHAGSHAIGPRNRVKLVRLLDFTNDATAAMEAAKKLEETFAAAHVELEQSRNKELIVSIKKVINTSFQDVEELVRLVTLAFNSVTLHGSRE